MALELDSELFASSLVHQALDSLSEQDRSLIEHFYFGPKYPHHKQWKERHPDVMVVERSRKKERIRQINNKEIDERLALALRKLQDWFLDEPRLTFHDIFSSETSKTNTRNIRKDG